uniref:FAS1 domain-containing protein n=1 Tax=Kalanchoe fedtschenkoi TaxID=63787 RepID=A0A7N0SZB3_KALFE
MASTPTSHLICIVSAVVLLIATTTSAHNVTAILEGFPEYSDFNHYLSVTKLADDINSHQTVTVLALTNPEMSSLTKHPLSVIKKVLSLHILLDYYDPKKLHQISDGTTLTTTLYQTTGNAPGNLGFVNITDVKGGKVCFGSAAPGSKLDSTYTKPIKQIPYNFSILEISQPIIAPGILTAPAPTASDVDIIAVLNKAGCKTFAGLLSSSGVLKTYLSAMKDGLTIFAPNDEAFKAVGVPDLTTLSNAELVSLLEYHAVPDYSPFGSLKLAQHPISTLATNGAGKYDFSVKTAGDSVTLNTGVDESRVASTVVDATPLVIFTVDSLLLPSEIFGTAPSPAPAGEAPSPTPNVSPSPSPEADAPSPVEVPAESPSDAADTQSDNGAGNVKATALLTLTLLTLSVILS